VHLERSTPTPEDWLSTWRFLLTATQTLLGVAALLALRFPHWAAWTLLGLFALQFALPGQTAAQVISSVPWSSRRRHDHPHGQIPRNF
jgi:hypothetical protein